MSKIFINPSKEQWAEIIQRPVFDSKPLEKTVSGILSDVKQHGDAAVKKYALQFDKVNFNYVLSASIALFVYSTVISQDIKSYSDNNFRQPDSMRKIIEDIINYIDSNC